MWTKRGKNCSDTCFRGCAICLWGHTLGLHDEQSISLILVLSLFFGRGRTAELWPLCPQGPTGKAAVMSSTASLLSAPNYPAEAGRRDGWEEEDTPRQSYVCSTTQSSTINILKPQ